MARGGLVELQREVEVARLPGRRARPAVAPLQLGLHLPEKPAPPAQLPLQVEGL